MATSTQLGPMTVALVLGTDIRVGGGAERLVQNLIRYCPSPGIRLTVFQTDNLDKARLTDAEVLELRGKAQFITVKRYLQTLDLVYQGRIGAAVHDGLVIPLASLLVKYLKDGHKYEVLDSMDVVYLIPNNHCRLIRKSKALVIGTNHNEFANRGLLNRTLATLIGARLWYRRIDGFILYPSNSSVLPRLGRHISTVLPNGVDTSVFYPRVETATHPLRFLYVSRLEPCKGLPIVLEAWRQSAALGRAELHIVGAGRLESMANAAVNTGVVYHGPLSTEDLAALYRTCDYFLFPSSCDAFGIVILEALASGLRVITTDLLRGTFDDFESLDVLEYVKNDVGVYAARIREIVADGAQRGVNWDARRLVVANFDWRRVAESLFSFLWSSLIEDRERRAAGMGREA